MATATSAARTPRADSAATRQRILNAAALLFGELGYSGTSMRAITESAGVNLAAVNYHFGGKEMLLDAAFRHCLEPVNQARLDRLDALEAKDQDPAIADIVRAFVEPIFLAGADPNLPNLLAKLFAEPKSISIPLLERTFEPVARRFFATLHPRLPHIGARDLQWRLHLLIGAMVHLANFSQPLNVFGGAEANGPAGTDNGLEHLIRFAVAGLCQNPGHPANNGVAS